MELIGKAPQRRLSDALIELARPELLHESESAGDWQPELLLAAMVWNGVVAGKTSAEILAQLRKGVELDPDLEALVETLVERKRRKFASDRRFVMGVQAFDTDDGIHVVVQSGR